jgi:LuxR family transcriptional regulator, maltose regulon positive regulatory protein
MTSAPQTSRQVRRSRLVQRLDEGVLRPLTLVSAPAGSGKSSLLAEWLAVGNPPGPVERVGLEADGPLSLRSAVRSAAAAVEPVVVVVDDFHLISSPQLAADLDRLLQRGGPNLRLLLATRSDPPLRLERLRVSGLMSEVRAADLAFTLTETHELLDALELSGEDVELLWRRTEGWIAGLRLAQLSLEGAHDAHAFVTSFAGDDRAVSDYLMSEVVDRQPAETLDFLLRTCVAERLTGDLADALTGGHEGERTLRSLERSDSLVRSIDGHGRWYRYHPLLLEVLRGESRRLLSDEQASLHRRAARWHARDGSALEAVRHAVEGGDWELAAEVTVEHWVALLTRGGGAALLDLAERIPREVVLADAERALALAGLRLEAGDSAGADELLAEAERLAPALPEPQVRRFEVTSTAVALYRARVHGDVEAALSAARLVLDGDWGRDLAVEVRALTLVHLGIAELWAGATETAGRHLQQAVGLALEASNDFVLFLAESYAAAVDGQSGRFADATARAEIAIELAERHGWTNLPHAAMPHLALASVQLWRGDLAEAERLGERAAAALAGASEPLLVPAVSLTRAALLALKGEPLTALDVVRGATAKPVPRLLHVAAGQLEADLWLALGEPDRSRRVLAVLEGPEAAVGLARLELASGDPEAALSAIAAFGSDEREPVIPFSRVEATVLAAVALDALRDESGALATLEHALDMAEPRGCAIVIVRQGAPLRSLLRRLMERGTRHRALGEELLAMLERSAGPEPVVVGPLLEPLSDRELTVLRFLPTMMSNAEIAAEMYVSVNTVKTHLKHVYRKLDVTDRRDCVRRGRELRLLSPGLGDG